MEKGIFVSDINEFTPVIEGIFVTCDVAKLNDKNGNPYWSLGLSDSTGTVQAKIWSQRGVLQPRELQSRSFVHVRGQANKFRSLYLPRRSARDCALRTIFLRRPTMAKRA